MKSLDRPRDRTRRAILDAMADVIVDNNGIGFSVQAVADRAGLSHRTVYNHFPSREALCEGFAAHVDEMLLASRSENDAPLPPSPGFTVEALPETVDWLYRALGRRDRYVRANVMLMIGNRRPLESWRSRSQALGKVIAGAAGSAAPLPPRQMAAAIRLFASSVGWHLLTEQCGLTNDEAAETSVWATRVLLAAATARRPPSTRRQPRRAATKASRPRG